MLGAVVSLTVTDCVPMSWAPVPSVTVQVTIAVPIRPTGAGPLVLTGQPCVERLRRGVMLGVIDLERRQPRLGQAWYQLVATQ